MEWSNLQALESPCPGPTPASSHKLYEFEQIIWSSVSLSVNGDKGHAKLWKAAWRLNAVVWRTSLNWFPNIHLPHSLQTLFSIWASLQFWSHWSDTPSPNLGQSNQSEPQDLCKECCQVWTKHLHRLHMCPPELQQPSQNPEANQPQDEVNCRKSRSERQKETQSFKVSLRTGSHFTCSHPPFLWVNEVPSMFT